ncbi:MAG: hypothetical protein KC476_04475 [Cyanobacteria bacterium HKST-UBA06]|nr:hypothetical protein [Cyanobacteria bacterium HKST-UBA06]
MKFYEIKGFWGLAHFIVMAALVLSCLTLVPILLTMVTWNAVMGDLLEGPTIGFWQAALLAAALMLGAHMVFKPEIEFKFYREEDLLGGNGPQDSDSSKKGH